MADSHIDYIVVLADLKAKRDQLDAAIAGIEAMLGLAPSSATPPSPATINGRPELGPGAFLGMSVVEATVKLLTARRQSLRTEEIVSELRRGGVAFSTDSPTNTVGSMLNRNVKQGGEIVSVGRGVWALAEWHPRLRRGGKKPGESIAAANAGTEPEGIEPAGEDPPPGTTDNPAELG